MCADTTYRVRDLSPSEGAAILRLYDVDAPPFNFYGGSEGLRLLDLAAAQRNAMRHASALGLLIVAALAGDDEGLAPLDIVDRALRGGGWTDDDVDAFLARDPRPEIALADRIARST